MKKVALAISESKWSVLFVVLISLLLHIDVFNKELVGFHVWRQTQTQSTIQSFAEEDFNILNPRKNERGAGDGIFRMEFPLSQWLTAIPAKIFADDVLVSRIVNFVFGALSLFGIYYLVKLIFASSILALLSAWILAFTPVVYYYTINPMPDNLALLLSIWGIYFFVRWYKSGYMKYFIPMVILFSLSGLSKLPFALVFSLPAVVMLRRLYGNEADLYPSLIEGLVFMLGFIPLAAWYLWVIPDWEGNGIVMGILSMSEDQKGRFWYYLWFNIRTNLPELLIGLPALPLFIAGVFSFRRLWRRSDFLVLVFGIWALLLSALIIFELNMIETVHDYYLLPFVPLAILIITYGLDRIISVQKMKTLISISLAVLILSLPDYTFFRINSRWDNTGFNEDLLRYREQLRDAVPDSALVCAGNDRSHHIFLYYIDKKGWAFEQNWMGPKKLDSLARLGCEYLYSDSRHVDQNPQVQSLFGTKVATFGEINIFKLRKPEDLN